LTRREREVARLVAQGLTNREIAAELVVTEGTAANHVRRLRLRLGFGSRARVAAWVAEDGRRWRDQAEAAPADPGAAALADGRRMPPPSARGLNGAAS
jgi:DNA-binding CsgD family transcriptional regulator